MTAVEFIVEKLTPFNWTKEQMQEHYKDAIQQAKEMETEQIEKLWTNEEVFDMLYKTDKFLMVDLREYWKTIEK